MDNDKDLTPEEIEAAKAKADAEKEIEISDELFEKLVEKKFGAKSSELVKKTELITEDEKKLNEQKEKEREKEEDIRFGLEAGHITAKEYEEYIQTLSEDKVDLARKKFIRLNSEIGVEEATEMFNTMLRQNENDEIEDGEEMKPNTEKAAAKKWATALADEEINSKFEKFKTLSEKRKDTKIILEAVYEFPKRFEKEIGGIKFGIEITDEDIAEAKNMALTGAGKKVTKEGVAANISAYIQTKKIDAIIQEGIRAGVSAKMEANKRGLKGVFDGNDSRVTTPSSEFREFLKKHGIPV